MALRIGCDLDGVLADMETALVRQAEVLFGAIEQAPPLITPASASMKDLVPEEVTDNAPLRHELQLTPRQRRTLWRHVSTIENFWETLDEIEPGVVARLATLAQGRKWEIVFLTRRPMTEGATSQIQSQRWLEAKGFRLPSAYVVTGSRGLIAAALTLDIVIDDTPENCVDVAVESKARTIAVLRNSAPPPALRRMGIHVVRSTHEALDVLLDIDSSLERQPGALARVMRTLGLKQPTSV
jgi:hypothetical protein